MILTDADLTAALTCGALEIEPSPALDQIQPASIELHLDLSGGALRPIPGAIIEIKPGVKVLSQMDADPCEGGRLILAPGACALVTTRERVKLAADLSAQVTGKSSLARLNLSIHVTAGWIDPGFDGQITLELVNHSPQTLSIRDGIRIAQLVVMRCSSPAARPYGHAALGSHYQGQTGATASKFGG